VLDLYRHVERNVVARFPDQRPVLKADPEDNYAVARCPSAVRPAPTTAAAPSDFVYDVLLVYAPDHRDRGWARVFVQLLEERGVRVCAGELDAEPGSHRPPELERLVSTSRFTMPVLTPRFSAGRFQQLAVRVLASSPAGFRRGVIQRLDPETALVTRACVAAARSLRGLTAPQGALPPWRIVPPRPSTQLLGFYQDAQRRIGVPWTYLAAINLVETRMGRIRGASTAGALGPMQFLPSTWALYGAGGDINDPRDSILAAARLLRANGATRDMAGALFHYNPSNSYVRAVSEYARTMQRSESAYRGYWHWRVLYRSRSVRPS